MNHSGIHVCFPKCDLKPHIDMRQCPNKKYIFEITIHEINSVLPAARTHICLALLGPGSRQNGAMEKSRSGLTFNCGLFAVGQNLP
jgi:hypothetical protein